MNSIGLDINNCSKPVFEKSLYSHLVDNWKQEINRENAKRGAGKNKLRTYRLLKQDYAPEEYVLLMNRSHRGAMAKFRSGTAPIRIETGRYEGIPVDERFCPFCPNQVESELHVILDCHVYEELTNPLFSLARDIDINFCLLYTSPSPRDA